MTILRNPHKVIHQPEYMMTISLQFHKLDSLQWPIAIVDYPARGQAPEIFAMRLKKQAAQIYPSLKNHFS